MKRLIFLLAAVLAGLLIYAPSWGEQKTLYEKQSAFSQIIVTEDENGLRTLLFEKGGARQSVVKVGDPDHLELPYAAVMLGALAFCDKPKRVLMIGLGGGTIPSFLRKHYPRMEIDIVEIDPAVVLVAKQFFGFREDRAMRTHVGDGRRFIEECKKTYDIIFLDAFGSENIPYHLATQEFLWHVRQALAPGGLAVGNVWARNSNPLYDSMVRTYQEAFNELYILEAKGSSNRILIALPRTARFQRDQLAERARKVSKQGRFRFDLSEAITNGFNYAQEKNPAGEVLKDKK
jgi:spermidine synthase